MSAAIVWHFSDGKAGDVNRDRGRLAANTNLTPTETHVIEVENGSRWKKTQPFQV